MRVPNLFLPLLAALAVMALPSAPSAQISIGISITVAPPELPVYVQPEIPGPGYIWSPGYWAWGDDDYYWVPGTWVEAPSPGLLWTPGYWGCNDDGIYVWNAGYWGPTVGFYGGISYGFGYTGVGFYGGRWEGGVFAYNRAVTNVGSVRITNVYNQTVINNTTVIKTSFNGGKGGITARPTPLELAAAKEPHVAPTALQTQHQQAASTNRALFASVNQGKPAVAASPKPGVFSGRGVVAAKTLGTGAKGAPGSGQSLTGVKGTGQAATNSSIAARRTGQTGTNSATGVKGTGQAGTNSATGTKGTGSAAAALSTGGRTPRPPGPGPQFAPKPPPPPVARIAAPRPPPRPPVQPRPPAKDAGKKQHP